VISFKQTAQSRLSTENGRRSGSERAMPGRQPA
jgi:hypothetical protein